MILNQSGQSIEIDGTVFAVGVRIGANSKSEYYGLEGRIIEIATDDDKDTENEGPDIYCCFDTPTEQKIIKRLEKEFSNIFCSPRTIDDIILDNVIMSSEEIYVIENPQQE